MTRPSQPTPIGFLLPSYLRSSQAPPSSPLPSSYATAPEATAPEDIPRYPTLHIGMIFETLQEAQQVITDATIQARESFDVQNAKPKFWALWYRGRGKYTPNCKYKLRVALVGKPAEWVLRIFEPHTCPTECHDNWQRPQGVAYLGRRHFDLVANNRKIPSKLVQDEARLRDGNKISSRQAHRTIMAVRSLIEGDKSMHF